jgi:hypothetical protein
LIFAEISKIDKLVPMLTKKEETAHKLIMSEDKTWPSLLLLRTGTG